jgi:hypothetical protein
MPDKGISLVVDKELYKSYREIMRKKRVETGATVRWDLRAVVEKHMSAVVAKATTAQS